VNDRLVRLNGVSLIGRSNSQTMSTLRDALQRRGTVAGYVDLVVARQSSSQPALTHCCSSDVHSDTPSPLSLLPPPAPRDDRCSRKPPTTHVVPPPPPPPTKTSKAMLRNVSYQMANADSFVGESSSLSTPRGTAAGKSLVGMKAPTINDGRADTVLIETDGSRSNSVSLLSTRL